MSCRIISIALIEIVCIRFLSASLCSGMPSESEANQPKSRMDMLLAYSGAVKGEKGMGEGRAERGKGPGPG